MKRTHILTLLLPLLPLLAPPAALADGTSETCVVQITVTHQANDPFLLWQKQQPGTRSGMGVALDSQHVLVPEPLIRRATLIELQRAREGQKYRLTLVQSDVQAGLALLSCPPEALEGVRHLALVDKVGIGDEVNIVKLDETREPERGKGTVFRALVEQMDGSPYQGFVLKVKTEMHPDSPGAAVLEGDKLAGLVMGYNGGERVAQVLPSQAIAPFVQPVLEGTYQGIASAGFVWQPLVDPAKRAHLGAKEVTGGVHVLSGLPGFDAGEVLKPRDVLVSWDGYAIDELGFFQHPDYGRLRFSYLIRCGAKPGQEAKVQVVRDGKLEDVTLRVDSFNDWASLVPENSEDLEEPYLIEGGLMLRELSGRFMRAHGRNWQTAINARLTHTYLDRRLMPESPGDRVVILYAVLPDSINIGYQHLRYMEVEALNGKPIHNLRDAIAIKKADGFISSVRLKTFGVDLALDPELLPEANARIQGNYQIPELVREPLPETIPSQEKE